MLDIYGYIRKDHKVIRDLMDRIAESQDTRAREQAMSQFHDLVERHARAEEVSFYAALLSTRDAETARLIAEAEEQHGEVTELFEELREMKPCSNRWFITFGQLRQAVEHHMRLEEKELFEHASHLLPGRVAFALASKMDMLKQRHTDNGLYREPEADRQFLRRLFAA